MANELSSEAKQWVRFEMETALTAVQETLGHFERVCGQSTNSRVAAEITLMGKTFVLRGGLFVDAATGVPFRAMKN